MVNSIDTDEEKRIIEAIRETNDWWINKVNIGFKHRDMLSEANKYFDARQMLIFTGLRRTGKTTLMLKLADLNAEKYDKTNIFYFSFDDFKKARIRDILNTYTKIMNKDLRAGAYLFLFDEVQKLDNWAEQIKRIYDNFKNIKILISGSEALFIRKNSRESLAGRFFEFKIIPLNFREYLEFKNKKIENLQLQKDEVLREFYHFSLCNGFPELTEADAHIIKKYIKENIIEKIIYVDIPQTSSISNPSILEDIFKIISYNPGQIINMNDLSSDLGLSRQTTSAYLDQLEKSFLIKKIYNFSKNQRKTQKKLKKYYPQILLPELIDNPELKGKIFETKIILMAEAEFFWRDTYKNEIDIIKTERENITPIEIKYSKPDYSALKIFMRKFKVRKGIIITYDTKNRMKTDTTEIEIIPFYEYFLNEISTKDH